MKVVNVSSPTALAKQILHEAKKEMRWCWPLLLSILHMATVSKAKEKQSPKKSIQTDGDDNQNQSIYDDKAASEAPN